MKLKIFLIIAAAFMMIGCAGHHNNTANAADQQVYTGELKFKPGSGLTYVRNQNQCGKNCSAHAELAAKMDKERAAQEAAGNPEWERIVKREKDAYKRLTVYNKCRRGVDIHLAGYQDYYEKAILENGFNSKKARAAATEFMKARDSSGRLINECVEYGLKQQ